MLQDFLSQWNGVSDLWLNWMIRCMTGSMFVLMGVGLLWVLIRKRATPQLGYLLFLLVPLKLLIPLEIAVPASWLPWKSGASPISVESGLSPVIISPAANSPQPASLTSIPVEVPQRTTSAQELPVSPVESLSSLAQETGHTPVTPLFHSDHESPAGSCSAGCWES